MVLSRTTKERDKMYIGYGNLVREALRRRADLLRDDVCPVLWKHPGVVMSKQNKTSCLFVLHENTSYQTENIGHYKPFYFSPPSCKNIVTNSSDLLCSNCDKAVPNLKKICMRAHDRANAGGNKNTRNDYLLSSPSVTKSKLDRLTHEGKKRIDMVHKGKKQFALNLERKGIKCNMNHAELFPPNLEELGQQFFTDNKVSQENLMRYLWAESCQHARVAAKSGKQSVSFYIFIL